MAFSVCEVLLQQQAGQGESADIGTENLSENRPISDFVTPALLVRLR